MPQHLFSHRFREKVNGVEQRHLVVRGVPERGMNASGSLPDPEEVHASGSVAFRRIDAE